jgi:hypothetical protein
VGIGEDSSAFRRGNLKGGVAEPLDFDWARGIRDIAQAWPVDDVELVAERQNTFGYGKE